MSSCARGRIPSRASAPASASSRLVKRYGAERVDAACARALVLGTRSYTSVAAILKNRRETRPAAGAEPPLLIHENIRGPGYYH